MEIRRPIAALAAALALFAGGATLTACGDPGGRNTRTGTPIDSVGNTEGNNPADKSQGNLPNNSDRVTDTDRTGTGDGSG